MALSTSFYGCDVEDIGGIAAVAPNFEELMEAILVMKPKPSPYPLIRLGGTGDGAYLLPDDLSGVKACFSPGVSNFKHFEDELTEKYKIHCHMCDKSSDLDKLQTPLKLGFQTFEKKWLDINGSDDSITLDNWVEERYPNPEDDLILQIDIEGAEYRNLLQASEATLSRFRIIIIEFHDLSKIISPNVFRNVFSPLLKKIDSLFVCLHAHPNNCCGDFRVPGTDLNLPHVHEVTFLRRDRINAGSSVEEYPPIIPHPLDIGRNVQQLAPLFLDKGWTGGRRSPEACIKILEVELDYQKYINVKTSDQYNSIAVSLYRISQAIYRETISKRYDLDSNYSQVDVAAGKPFVLTSAYGNFPITGTVNQKDGFFFSTNFGINESITIDLLAPYYLRKLSIRNRSDMCFDRANFLFYVLHETPDRGTNAAYPIEVSDAFLLGDAPECDTLIPGLLARYVTIFSACHTALHFSSIQVFTVIAPPVTR